MVMLRCHEVTQHHLEFHLFTAHIHRNDIHRNIECVLLLRRDVEYVPVKPRKGFLNNCLTHEKEWLTKL